MRVDVDQKPLRAHPDDLTVVFAHGRRVWYGDALGSGLLRAESCERAEGTARNCLRKSSRTSVAATCACTYAQGRPGVAGAMTVRAATRAGLQWYVQRPPSDSRSN